MKKGVVACDLGASSGRIMFIELLDNEIVIEEIHRFKNEPLQKEVGLFWEFQKIFSEIKFGIKKTIEKGYKVLSLGIDTWGVDYGWLDEKGQLIQDPYCYRDDRVDSILDEVHKKIDLKELFFRTGNSFYKFNTIYQLYADLKRDENIIKNGREILFLPNLIGYFLTGNKVSEYSIASTSGLLDQSNRIFDEELLKKLEISKEIFPKLTEAGIVLGYLKEELAKEFSCEPFPIINVNCHDSASAINYCDNFQQGNLFLINGTWSLIGILSDTPIKSELAYKYKITNEGQEGKKNRVIRLIPGTWILQRLKHDFEIQNKNYTFEDFGSLAQKSNELETVDLENEKLVFPSSMIEAMKCLLPLKNYTDADYIKIAYNSILKKYKESIDILENISEQKIKKIYALGGGIQDTYLMNLIQKDIQMELELGVIEASIVGNAKTQLFALGLVNDESMWNELVMNYSKKERW